MKLNVLDFPGATIGASAAAALEQSRDGDSLYFPGVQFTHGLTYRAPVGGFQITKSLEIYGDGPGDVGIYTGTIFTALAGDPVFAIAPPSSGEIASVRLRDFKIKTPPTPDDGIKCVLASGQTVKSLRIERVNVFEVGGVGFNLSAANLGDIRMVALLDSVATLGLDLGAVLRNVVSARCVRTLIERQRQRRDAVRRERRRVVPS